MMRQLHYVIDLKVLAAPRSAGINWHHSAFVEYLRM